MRPLCLTFFSWPKALFARRMRSPTDTGRAGDDETLKCLLDVLGREEQALGLPAPAHLRENVIGGDDHANHSAEKSWRQARGGQHPGAAAPAPDSWRRDESKQLTRPPANSCGQSLVQFSKRENSDSPTTAYSPKSLPASEPNHQHRSRHSGPSYTYQTDARPCQNRSADCQQTFLVKGKLPFASARTIPHPMQPGKANANANVFNNTGTHQSKAKANKNNHSRGMGSRPAAAAAAGGGGGQEGAASKSHAHGSDGDAALKVGGAGKIDQTRRDSAVPVPAAAAAVVVVDRATNLHTPARKEANVSLQRQSPLEKSERAGPSPTNGQADCRTGPAKKKRNATRPL